MPESQSVLDWDKRFGWGNIECQGKLNNEASDPRIYSPTKITTSNRKDRPRTVKPNKKRFLPTEGSNNFELEFEVKALKNAFINLCKKEKIEGVETKRCFEIVLGVLESGNYISYIKHRNEDHRSKEKETPYILDEKYYNAFKLVFEEKALRLYNTDDKTRNALKRQHRDESDFMTDEFFDIQYNDIPLLEYSLVGLSETELNSINHVEFATEDTIGYWNVLIRNKQEKCYDGLCPNDGECKNGFNRYTCLCKEGFEGYNCEWDINYSEVR